MSVAPGLEGRSYALSDRIRWCGPKMLLVPFLAVLGYHTACRSLLGACSCQRLEFMVIMGGRCGPTTLYGNVKAQSSWHHLLWTKMFLVSLLCTLCVSGVQWKSWPGDRANPSVFSVYYSYSNVYNLFSCSPYALETAILCSFTSFGQNVLSLRNILAVLTFYERVSLHGAGHLPPQPPLPPPSCPATTASSEPLSLRYTWLLFIISRSFHHQVWRYVLSYIASSNLRINCSVCVDLLFVWVWGFIFSYSETGYHHVYSPGWLSLGHSWGLM